MHSGFVKLRPDSFSHVVLAIAAATLFLLPGGLSAHPELVAQIDSVTSEIERAPRNPVLFLRRGQLHGLHADVAAAVDDFTRAQDMGTSDSDILLARGQMYLDNNRLELALSDLNQLVRQYPTIARGHLALATLMTRRNQMTEAADELTSAIELYEEPTAEMYLARADALAAAGKLPAAIQSLDRAVTEIGPLVSLHLKAAELEERAGHTSAAVTRLERLAEGSIRKEPHLLRLAELHRRTGETTQAMTVAADGIAAMEALPTRVQRSAAARRTYNRLIQLRNNAPVRYINDTQSTDTLKVPDETP